MFQCVQHNKQAHTVSHRPSLYCFSLTLRWHSALTAGWSHSIMWHHRFTWQPGSGSRKQFSHIKGWITEKSCTLFLPSPTVSITLRARLNIWPLMSFQRQVGCLRAFILEALLTWRCDLLITYRNFNHVLQHAWSILLRLCAWHLNRRVLPSGEAC